MSRRHIVMVTTEKRLRCACELSACPNPPQLGDPLCRACRAHCYPELVRLEKARKRRRVLAVALGIVAASWAAGHFLGPLIGG